MSDSASLNPEMNCWETDLTILGAERFEALPCFFFDIQQSITLAQYLAAGMGQLYTAICKIKSRTPVLDAQDFHRIAWAAQICYNWGHQILGWNSATSLAGGRIVWLGNVHAAKSETGDSLLFMS
nr:MAG: hypothetical protein A2Z04_08310 [Chloroflexi bacterium RBG_16_57_9]